MNQEQRKFLVEQVQKTCTDQIDKLRKQIPPKPSLNNYLIAAFLDNSIQFNNISVLQTKMRKTVLEFGSNDVLIKKKDTWRSNRHSDNEEEEETVEINPTDLFIIPQNYLDAVSTYKEKKYKLDKEIEELEATKRTIIMKIQIGSSAAMDKLVMQIDSIGDLSILNTQLMLTAGDKE